MPSINPLNRGVVIVDTSFIGANDPAGFGGWLRDNHDEWVQKHCYVVDALMAELMSILEGLILAKSHGFEYITILSDSTQAINLVSKNVIYNDIYYNVLKNGRVYKQEFEKTNFAYVRREKNKLADCLFGILEGILAT